MGLLEKIDCQNLILHILVYNGSKSDYVFWDYVLGIDFSHTTREVHYDVLAFGMD